MTAAQPCKYTKNMYTFKMNKMCGIRSTSQKKKKKGRRISQENC